MEEPFASLCDEVLAAARSIDDADDPLTHFEIVTAMALLYFSREGVEYAVLEVGLGGRLDATNAVSPILSILTSIGLEHTNVLGKTTCSIAREKAGILRPGVPCVCAVQNQSALTEIKKRAKRLDAPLHLVDENEVRSFSLIAAGSFQRRNAAEAAKAARLLGVGPALIRRTLSHFIMPARWQKMSSTPSLLIDCCHNPPQLFRTHLY